MNSTKVVHRNSTKVVHTNSTKVVHMNNTKVVQTNSTKVVHTNSTKVVHTNSTKVYTLIVDVGVPTNSTHVLQICSHLNSRSSSDSQSGNQRLELLLLLFYTRSGSDSWSSK